MSFLSPMIWLSGSNLWPSVWKWFGLDFTNPPALNPLWFLRTLMLLILVSPLLFCALQKVGWWLVVACFVFCACVVFFSPDRGIFIWTLRPEALLYFSVGMCLRWYSVHVIRPTLVGMLSLLASIVLVVVSRSWCSSCFFIPLFMLGLWLLMPTSQIPKWLTGMAFPIYLIHPFVIKLFSSAMERMGNGSLLLLLVQFVCVVGLSIGCAQVIRIFAPRWSVWLFGGR